MDLSAHHLDELVAALFLGGALSLLLIDRRLRPWLPVVVGAAGLVALVAGRPGLASVAGDSVSFAPALAALVALPTAERFGRDAAPRVACVVMVIGLGGVFTTVPDTEVPLRLIGAMAPPLVVGIAVSDRVPLPYWAVVPVPLLIAVSISAGDRTAAAIAGVGCLGIVLAEPIANITVRPRTWLADDPGTLLLCAALQLAIVGICSRVVESRSAAGALLLVGATLVVTAVGLRVRLTQLGRSRSHRSPHPE